MSEMPARPALCANCGAEMSPGAGFCAACGHKDAQAPQLASMPAVPTHPATGAPKTKKGWGVGRILVVAFVIAPLFLVAGVTVALVVWSNLNPPACACSLPPAVEMTDGYHAMVGADNVAIVQRDSPDVTTSIAGLNARAAAHKNFDNQVAALAFTSAAGTADQQKVLDADKALEQVISEEAASRSNVKDYNALLGQEKPLDDAFAAAVTQLGND